MFLLDSLPGRYFQFVILRLQSSFSYNFMLFLNESCSVNLLCSIEVSNSFYLEVNFLPYFESNLYIYFTYLAESDSIYDTSLFEF